MNETSRPGPGANGAGHRSKRTLLATAAAVIAVVTITGAAILVGPFATPSATSSPSPGPAARTSASGSPSATATPSVPATPAASPTATPTAAPTATPTATPEPTPKPTATDAPEAAAAVDGFGRIEGAGGAFRGLWALQKSRLLLSTDGGGTWTGIRLPAAETPGELPSSTPIAVVDAAHAWMLRAGPGTSVTGQPGDTITLQVYRTANGGATWKATIVPGNFIGFENVDVLFADATHGFIIGDNWSESNKTVFRTTDGGVTWTAATRNAVVGNRMILSDSSTLWASAGRGGEMCFGCNNPLLSVSRDAGKTWTAVALPGYAGKVNSPQIGANVFFAGPSFGIASVDDQTTEGHPVTRLFRTADGGRTWSSLRSPSQPLATFWPVDANHWFAVTASATETLIATDDAGATWHTVTPWQQSYSAFFVDPKHGGWLLFGGESGAVLWVTSDGGRSWTRARFPAR